MLKIQAIQRSQIEHKCHNCCFIIAKGEGYLAVTSYERGFNEKIDLCKKCSNGMKGFLRALSGAKMAKAFNLTGWASDISRINAKKEVENE
jgi:hypothetical protein